MATLVLAPFMIMGAVEGFALQGETDGNWLVRDGARLVRDDLGSHQNSAEDGISSYTRLFGRKGTEYCTSGYVGSGVSVSLVQFGVWDIFLAYCLTQL